MRDNSYEKALKKIEVLELKTKKKQEEIDKRRSEIKAFAVEKHSLESDIFNAIAHEKNMSFKELVILSRKAVSARREDEISDGGKSKT